MKKLITTLGLLPLLACADEPAIEEVKVTEGYVSLGFGPLPLPAPVFGVGARFQEGHHGCDLSAQVATVIENTALKENLVYLHYFKPSLASESYLGLGVGFTEIFSWHSSMKAFVSPQVLFGKEYTNESGDRRFFQAQVDFPFVKLDQKKWDRVGLMPCVVISYGVCF